MVGFSDTERVSGLTALISIQKVKEDILLLAKDLGLQVKFYHGPGGDTNRGGLARRDEKGTLQGNARSNLLTTPQSTLRYREAQFYRAYHEKANPSTRLELASKMPHIQEGIDICQKEGIAFYEFLHDPENGLGKLFAAFVGHGPHWLVSILNLSSRASQRGVVENQGDRSASVQKGGVRPSLFSDLNKLRAITATQSKELLRDNTHLLMGPGRAFRSINRFYMERLLDSSETMRDFFLKAVLGDSFSDYSVTAHALFAEYPELKAKNPQQRKEWAKECETYPERLKMISIKDLMNNKDELLIMLSRLFAFLEEEAAQTKVILQELMQALHFSKEPRQDKLSPYTEWQAYTDNAIHEVEPLSLILARQNHHIIQGRNLDEVYLGLNKHSVPGSKLSGVSRLLGNIGAGITAFRIMPPPFCEINYRNDLRPGVARAEQERSHLSLKRTLVDGPTTKLKLFDVRTTSILEEMLEKRLKKEEEGSAKYKF